jgi:hypothetical protein
MTVKSANLWFLFSIKSKSVFSPANDVGEFVNTKLNERPKAKGDAQNTWSNSDRFVRLPHINFVDSQIPKIGKIHDAPIGYRFPPSVLLHARPRVPPGSKNIFTFAGVDDHASTCFTRTSFDMVDGGCERVDEDRGDPDRLSSGRRREIRLERFSSANRLIAHVLDDGV